MAYARDGLAEALADLEIQQPSCPVVLNVTAKAASDPGEIRERLLEQLTAPVRWAQSLEEMQRSERFIEVGSGKVLSGLVKRTLGRDATTTQAGTADEIDALTA
jgi:[acyl-carrier-protein] S-malonyltransferase